MNNSINSDQFISIPLDLIEPFKDNSRLVRNSKHDEIKNSIEARGLDTTLTVTKFPGSEKYTIAAGGNTRLQCLKELYQETGEDEYRHNICRVIPFPGELALLAGHYSENDDKGKMSFIEKSILAVKIIKQVKEPKDSYRVLADKIKKKGVSIPYSQLPAMEVAVELLEYIPTALKTGLGRPTVQALSQIKKALFSIFDELKIPRAVASEVYNSALILSDSTQFSLCELGACMKNSNIIEEVRRTEPNIHFYIDMIVNDPAGYSTRKDRKTDQEGSVDSNKATSQQEIFPEPALKAKPADSLQSLRKKAFKTAKKIAGSLFGMQAEVVESEFGYGFGMDLPQNPYRNNLASTLWVMLFSISGVVTTDMAETKSRICLIGLSRFYDKGQQNPNVFSEFRSMLNLITYSVGGISAITTLLFPDQIITHTDMTSEEQEQIFILLKTIKLIRTTHEGQLWQSRVEA
ncbi:ParB family protein [Endozoicomonas sp. ALC066]|uniref:ParB family protein n=1 Tax=Endozoicomonas sp. ALC066 TaxID=3403078 RepID=UPI003BB75FB2